MTPEKLPYPVTIVRSRYGGIYEGAKWLAFNLDPEELESHAKGWDGGDGECSGFFYTTKLSIGRGETPDLALNALICLLPQEELGL